MQHVYLSRRNLLTLLSKLDRNLELAESSKCTIIKQDTTHPKYPCTDATFVTAVEDEEYYVTGDRGPGRVHPADDPRFKS